MEPCEVCGQEPHAVYCYLTFPETFGTDDDYFEALYTTEPTESEAA